MYSRESGSHTYKAEECPEIEEIKKKHKKRESESGMNITRD